MTYTQRYMINIILERLPTVVIQTRPTYKIGSKTYLQCSSGLRELKVCIGNLRVTRSVHLRR